MTNKEINDLFDKYNTIALLTWMTLGDGNITLPSKGINAYMQITHSEKQEDYIRFKEAFISIVTGVTVDKYYHSGQGNYNWCLRTRCHPVFTKLRKQVYLDKRKVIQPHAVKLMTPACLAVLYQDDGRFAPSKSTISISMPLFSKAELLMLAKGIVDKWGIIFRVRRCCVLKDGTIGHELGLRYSDKDKFFDLIMPYVSKSMLYKVGRGDTSKDVMRCSGLYGDVEKLAEMTNSLA